MRRSVTVFALLGVSVLTPASSASAWDYPGHRIVGAIADIVLSQRHPQAHAKVTALLTTKDAAGNPVQRTLSEVAVFPDCAKNEEQYCRRKPSTEETAYVLRNLMHKSYHFTNAAYQQKRYVAGSTGTSETDVVQMIDYAVAQLQGKKPYKYEVELTNTEALWLLAHLVGDIHQPLHVGQVYFDARCERVVDPNASRTIEAITTLGGNLVKLPNGPIPNLHLYWDATTVATAMKKEGVEGNEHAFAEKLAATPPPAGWEMSGDLGTWPEKWVAEAMEIARAAYEPPLIEIKHNPAQDRRPTFPSATISCGLTAEISPEYEAWAVGVAQAQVQKAGHRLAALLAAIFP